jgi:cytochrome b6-f complex iron-sulfur subunit
MNRRHFNLLGLGLLASALPIAITACQSDDSPTAAAPEDTAINRSPRDDGFVALGTVDELDAAGSLSSNSFQGQTVVVIRSPDNPDTLIAVDALCPHQGCTVAWEDDQGLFACPCHGSQFGPDGDVITGPASIDLSQFEAKIEEDVVLVTVS